jgi:hypothetical protein
LCIVLKCSCCYMYMHRPEADVSHLISVPPWFS